MSRKLILFIATSLDGYIAKENDDLDWLDEVEGEGDTGYTEMYNSIDTMIMGKKTYDYVVRATDEFPHSDKKCYVFSRSEKGESEHVEFVNENVVPFTKRLKQQPGSNIWMAGGSDILDAFLKEKLIDEFIITITPHILGKGVPLFKDNSPEIYLSLQEVKRFGQFVQLIYKPK